MKTLSLISKLLNINKFFYFSLSIGYIPLFGKSNHWPANKLTNNFWLFAVCLKSKNGYSETEFLNENEQSILLLKNFKSKILIFTAKISKQSEIFCYILLLMYIYNRLKLVKNEKGIFS